MHFSISKVCFFLLLIIKLVSSRKEFRLSQKKFYSERHECLRMLHLDFDACAKQGLRNLVSITLKHERACQKKDICKHEFTILYIRLMPYFDMRTQLNQMLQSCCGSCAKLRVLGVYDTMSEINVGALEKPDFVFPYLGPTSSEELFGFYFVPMISVTNAYLFTLKQTNGEETFRRLINEIIQLWPFVVTCLVLAMVSGCVAWLLETWGNEEQFPRLFLIGAFEGFWWSFISMTTVGYGDKYPKSWLARVFAVVWILFGITICSMFTAALTTAITSVFNPKTPTINGGKVGALKHRLHEALIIADQGGTLHSVDDFNVTSGIEKLVDLLSIPSENEKIDSFVLDSSLVHAFTRGESRSIKKRIYQVGLMEKFRSLVATRVSSKHVLSIGLLVKQKKHYYYFQRYFNDNRIEIEACLAYAMNNRYVKDKKSPNYLFSVSNGTFLPMIYWCVSILACIAFVGFMFQIMVLQCGRDKMKLKKNEY